MKYRAGYKYQLAENEVFHTALKPAAHINADFIHLSPSGIMVIRAGYAWDGPSGPTIDTKNSMRGSLFHDAAYQLMRLELIPQDWRVVADEELGRFLKEDGMWGLRRYFWVRELKKFGAPAASPENKKPVLEAP